MTGPRRPNLRRMGAALSARARSVPVTWTVVALTLVASVLRMTLQPGRERGNVDAFVSTGFDAVFVHHDWLSTLTAVFFVHNPVVLGFVLVVVLVTLGWSERRMGHLRTVLAFVIVTVVGIALALALQGLGVVLDLYAAEITRTHRVVDPLIAVAGVVMTASAFCGPLMRRRVRIVGFTLLAVFTLYSGAPSDQFRLYSAVVGLLLGLVLARTRIVVRVPRASRREARTLLGAVVAVTALGPLVTIAAPQGVGILNPLGLLFRDPLRDYAAIAARCQTGDYSRHCVDALALSRLDGPGAVLLTVLPLVALLVAARGIQLGKRVALHLGVWINVALALLAAVYYGFLPLLASSEYTRFQQAAADDYRVFELVSVAVPLVIAIVLASSGRLFPPETARRPVLRFALTVVAIAAACSVLYLGVAWLARDQFSPTASLYELLLDLPERFVPVGFLAFEPFDIVPQGPVAVIASQWIGPVFWVAVIVAAVRGMLTGHPVTGHAAEGDGARRVRELLRAGSGGTLAWMTTWPGNRYWFGSDGGAVAYRVVGGVAVTTGDPLGPPSGHARTALEFAAHCADQGWTPAFYSVTDELQQALQLAGWSSLQVAEETVVRPAGWSLDGKKMQDIRTAINRAAKEGLRAEWVRYGDLPSAQTAQIREISELWVAEKELPEMGFTLGGLDELIDPDVMLMIGLDEAGRVHGVTSWLPTFSDGTVVGLTLDFMRRRPDGMNGLMEFLIAQTILRARDEGVDFVSLSGAPLAVGSAPDARATAMDGVLAFLSRTLEPVYGFRSLLRFKLKFRPELHRLHLCYPDPLTLPAIGLALARAYLPTLSARQAVRTFGRQG
ncbi:bifunctional lysylphosphatidylglycerol flippase/synthetase MprF [Herbiconiux sp. P18]|uniref:bifunctional lysylphosphatidylglycerol flippase/synthetase MprF n=1 Tax=Herbiconiux liangxiaofengii TaxID=3342795 RepID=UPI0035B95E52